MNEQIEATLSLRDGHSKEWQRFNAGAKAADGQLGILNKRVGEFAKGMTVFEIGRRALDGFVGYLRDSIGKAMEAQDATTALTESMRRVNDMASAGEMDDYYNRLADALNRSDEQMKRIATMFQTATGASQGAIARMMTGAVGLANQTNSTVDEVFLSIIQALETGISRGLRRFGLTIDETASKAENLQSLTDQMRKFESAAIAAAENASGQLRGLSEQWDEAKESFGSGFLRSFAANEEAVKSFGTTLGDMGEAVGAITKGALAGFDLLIAGVAKLMGYSVASWNWLEASLEDGFDSIYVDFQNLTTRIVGGWNVIVAAGEMVWDKLKAAFAKFWNWIAGTWVGKKLRLEFMDVDAQTKAAGSVTDAWIKAGNKIDDNNKAFYERQKQRDKDIADRWKADVEGAQGIADKFAAAAAGMYSKGGGVQLPEPPKGGGLTLGAHAESVVDMLQTEVLAEEKKTAQSKVQVSNAEKAASALKSAADKLREKVLNRLEEIRGAAERSATQGTRKRVERIDEDIDKAKARGDFKRAQELEEKRDQALGIGKFKAAGAKIIAKGPQAEPGAPAAGGKAAGGKSAGEVGAAASEGLDKIEELLGKIAQRVGGMVQHMQDIDKKLEAVA